MAIEGEFYLENYTRKEFALVGYQSKRLGNVALDKKGKTIIQWEHSVNKIYPVFISVEEYLAKKAEKQQSIEEEVGE